MTVNSKDTADSREFADLVSDSLQSGFADPSGTYPKPEYVDRPSTNKGAIGEIDHGLSIGGGKSGVSTKTDPIGKTRYPYASVLETQSGHVIVYDDTPGSERVIIKHRSGSGIEMRPDGSILIKADKNIISSVSGNSTTIIEGDTKLEYGGSVDMNIAGDFNINVAGNYSTLTQGIKSSKINGGKSENVNGNSNSVINGSTSIISTGQNTTTTLGGMTTIVKGAMENIVDGNIGIKSSGDTVISSAGKMNVSSADVNIAGDSLSIFGSSGTIGGESIIMYSYNSHVSNSVWADTISVTSGYGTTWHGDLDGTATGALESQLAGGVLPVNVGPMTNDGTQLDTTATALPTASVISEYLNNSSGGISKVLVDVGDFMRNSIDRSSDLGGVSDRDLSTTETRAKLRDSGNRSNVKFVGSQVSRKIISPNYAIPSPSKIGRVDNETGTPVSAETPVGIQGALSWVEKFIPSKNEFLDFFNVSSMYDPNMQIDTEGMMDFDEAAKIGPATPLGSGIPMSTFLGGIGDRSNLNKISSSGEKLDLAIQYTLQAQAYSSVLRNKDIFGDFRLVVVEGLYVPSPGETVTPKSINETKMNGQTVVYELHDSEGKISPEKTYDLAVYWKDSLNYDELILDYDHYDPNGSLNVQIILTMPEIDNSYSIISGKPANKLSTLYNNVKQGDELIEVIE